MVLKTDDFTVKRIEKGEKTVIQSVDSDYVICCVDALDSERGFRLLQEGFSFLDRVLNIEINILDFHFEISKGLPDIEYCEEDEFDEDIYQLAYEAFITDRRFHLDPVFDQKKANSLIKAYIDDCSMKGMKLYKARHGNNLLGFTIVDENAGNDSFENVLGATASNIKGKMIAAPLYAAMMLGQKEKFKKYTGKVSSSNAASINLHFSMGGKVKNIHDEYIYRKR